MKNTPKPGTKEFHKLGPQARTLARWRHQSKPIHSTTGKSREHRSQTTLQEASQ